MEPKPNTDLEQPPPDRADGLRREADANAEHSAQLGRHIRTFAQTSQRPGGDEHWTPALPFDSKTSAGDKPAT